MTQFGPETIEKILPIFQKTNISKPYVCATNWYKEKGTLPHVLRSYRAKHFDFWCSFSAFKSHTFAISFLFVPQIFNLRGWFSSTNFRQWIWMNTSLIPILGVLNPFLQISFWYLKWFLSYSRSKLENSHFGHFLVDVEFCFLWA